MRQGNSWQGILFSLRVVAGKALLISILNTASGAVAPHNPTPAGKTPEPWKHVQKLDGTPFQHATLLSGLGTISFPITTRNAEAQKFFNQGIAQLYGFWHAEAERSFRQVAALEPDCAMAYWGMALANSRDAQRATGFIKQALLKKNLASPRDQQWIDAYANLYIGTNKPETERRQAVITALEKLCLNQPDDLEARVFLLFQLWDNFEHGMPRPSQFTVEEIARKVLAKNPKHHGVHQCLFQLWSPEDGKRSILQSVAAAGPSAPSIAHQWYSAGLLLARLGRYDEAAWQHEAALRVENVHMTQQRSFPDESHLYAENYRALASSLAQSGRVREAADCARELIDQPRGGPEKAAASRIGQGLLLEILANHEMWVDLMALSDQAVLPQLSDTRDEAARLRTLGVAAFRSGQVERGKTLLRQLQIVRMKVRGRWMEAMEKAEIDAKKQGQPEEQVAQAIAGVFRLRFSEVNTVDSALSEVLLAQALLQGDRNEAERMLKELKDLPPLREAQIHSALDHRSAAVALLTKMIQENPAQVLPLALLADLQWRYGERDAASQTFRKLRSMSVSLDLTVPVFARLEPIAKAMNLPADWRIPSDKKPVVAALGKSPDLKSLGPRHLQPSTAPEWRMIDGEGTMRMLTEFRGRPVLMLFYLGSGCVHCIEQLNSFAPVAKQFADAGIDLVAVSTESPDDLHKTWEKATSGEGFPFPLLADPELATFKAYHAFDEFSGKPLHGAFLISGDGLLRWHNIGAEPFTEPEWLLEEAKRLLKGTARSTTTGVVVRVPAVAGR